MTRTTAILRVVVGVVTGAMVVSTMAFAGEPTAANDLIRFGEMQKRFEEARNLGLFTKAPEDTKGPGEELAYYYSERVPSKTTTETGLDYTRVVKTSLTDCSSSAGFPVSPKFLYGGLDPYSLVQKAKDTRVEFPHLDSPYANFFAASRADLGVCANFAVVSIQTGPSTSTQYVVLFKTEDNKKRFELERSQGLAPMPAVGFWCMWGLGNGSTPHLASPNNPQFAVYELKASKTKGLESKVYIGANYWPRTHGMGSPEVLPNLTEWLDEVLRGTAEAHDPRQMTPLRHKSVIFRHPLE